jgi:ParB family transcriptional regulator, chromosome partitioning protein
MRYNSIRYEYINIYNLLTVLLLNMLTSSQSSNRFFGEIDSLNVSNIMLPSHGSRINNDDSDIKKMANSIRKHGLLQPIVVRPKEDYFEVVAGCTRYLACKSLNWRKIPCHILHLNEIQTFEVTLIENIQRKSLTPLEEANAFKAYVFDKGWGSIADLASKIEKSSSYITKRIALLALPDDIQESIKNSNLKPSTADELTSIKDAEKQSQLANLIVKRHLTTMNVRKLVKEDPFYCENSEILEVRSELQSFNKSIIALRIAMSKIAAIIEEDEENLLVHEFMMYQKRLLHDQIDNIMNAKRKYARNIFRYRKIVNK